MNKAKLTMIIFYMFLVIFTNGYSPAAEDHKAGDTHSGMSMNTRQDKDIFLEERQIDAYTVHFHVMKVNSNIQLEGSHNFMVKIEDKDGIVENAVVNSKVIFPSGKSVSEFLTRSGEWYMKDYTLDEPGKYQLLILFKTADGEKHKGGVYYEHPKEMDGKAH